MENKAIKMAWESQGIIISSQQVSSRDYIILEQIKYNADDTMLNVRIWLIISKSGELYYYFEKNNNSLKLTDSQLYQLDPMYYREGLMLTSPGNTPNTPRHILQVLNRRFYYNEKITHEAY